MTEQHPDFSKFSYEELKELREKLIETRKNLMRLIALQKGEDPSYLDAPLEGENVELN